MKAVLVLSIIVLASYLSTISVFAESPSPVIIKQVEIDSPLKSDPRTTCNGLESIGSGPSTQWIELKNISNQGLEINGFTIRADNTQNYTLLQDGPNLSSIIVIASGQSCTFSFNCSMMSSSDQRCIQDTKDVIFTFEYNHGGTPHADGDYLYSDGGTVYKVSTPPLTDEINDAKTWQLVDDDWTFDNMHMKTISSPLQQFKSGLPIDMIQCDEKLQLILKTKNSNPACVKSETMQKLIERGWAKLQ